MKRAKSVDEYIADATHWQSEVARLCEIMRSTALEEGVKWGAPCYMLDGKNVVGVGAFKSYFGLWFFQGALLADRKNLLVNAQEGKTRALRQWRMNSASDINATNIKAYINEAMQLAREGKEIKPSRAKPVVIPSALTKSLRENNKAAIGYKKMRLGLRREYADYIADAKLEETKQRRIKKIMPMIIAGVGLHDKYR